MTDEIQCLDSATDDDVLSQTENLHRQAGALRKWSKSLLKRTAKPNSNDSQEGFSLEDGNYLISELHAHRHELEATNEELRWVKKELETSLKRHFDLYDLAPEGYFTLDAKGLIIEANLAAASLLGLEKEALLKQPLSSFILCESQDASWQKIFSQTVGAEPLVCECKMLRQGTTPFWARLKTTSTKDAAGDPVLCVVMSDISDRMLIEEVLREQEKKYRLVAESTHDWEFWLGPDEAIRYCSPACQKITGHSVAEFETDPSLMRQLVHPDDLARYDLHQHGVQALEIYDDIEFRIIHAEGSVHWLSHVCRPVHGANGEHLGTRGSNRDITERKFLEAERSKERNLESLGHLAAGIAHDFNNLFQGLLGNISLARMCIPDDSEACKYLENAENVYEQAAKLTAQLITFSNGGHPQRVEVQLSKYLKAAVTTAMSASELSVEFDLAPDLWQVNIDTSQFGQVIGNLVCNAKEAMPSGGWLRITAANLQLPSKNMPNSLPPGNYVEISIQDHGCGIAADDLPRIFDPYFSTKERCSQKGMGLGLALCKTIIQKHGGAITVESESQQGTTFHLFLPTIAPPQSSDMQALQRGLTGAGPRILIMDDDRAVNEVATHYLNHHGYRMDSASNGDAAIAAYQEAREACDPYAAVILDLTIPGGMGGKEVFAILKKTDPEVKAIVSSGYTDDPAILNYSAHGFAEVLAKPYHLQEMKAVLDRLV